jgi:molybdopterin molybdotransferase
MKSTSLPHSDPASAAPISFAQANAIVSAEAMALLSNVATGNEVCNLASAGGRVLAAPIAADRDQPPFDRAIRDGFAVRAEDLHGDVPLRVIGQLRAGEAWPTARPPLGPHEAIEIMTGAPLPPGANAVLMVEHTRQAEGGMRDEEPSRSILPEPGRSLAIGENIVARGTEARQGQSIVGPGRRIGAAEIALAAACGLQSLPVFPLVPVAILATGDELVEHAAEAPVILPHQIYDSNSHALVALVQQCHGKPVRQRAARDDHGDLAESIRQGFAAAPLLLLTGGVSMGKYDLVEEVLAAMGAEFFFTGVRIQPGKPVVFGRLASTAERAPRYFFGLPGNPVSTMVTFRLFVEPLLAAMSGERDSQPRIALAQLAGRMPVKPGLTRFLPARLDTAAARPAVTPVKTQGSGDLAANARANCYVIVPDDCEILDEGQMVRVLLIP